MANYDDIQRLFLTHYAQMHRLARVIVHNDELAKDIVNDVFSSLLQRESNEEITSGYLMSSVRNRCLNHLRDADIRTKVSCQYPLETLDVSEVDAWPDEETLSRLSGLIATRLTPQCRRVVELRYVEGMTYAQIGETLGISKVAVYNHLRHAIEILRKNMM